MNIKITKEEFDYIYRTMKGQYIIGSGLYRTNTKKSDTDILCIYDPLFESDIYYPNYHQLQYDDIENNTQYILTSKRQFYHNMFSGDSTINVDVVLFCWDTHDDQKLNIVRTYNIIKAFIGFAKRDLKQVKSGKNKLFHIERGLYCAEELMENRMPDISKFKTFNSTLESLKEKEAYLRAKCNSMYEKNELTLYPKEPIIRNVTDLELKIINANNIKEFKY